MLYKKICNILEYSKVILTGVMLHHVMLHGGIGLELLLQFILECLIYGEERYTYLQLNK